MNPALTGPHSSLWQVGVYADVRDSEGRILLVHRRDENIWQSPGGGVDDPESVSDAVVRETLEESGFEVEVMELLGTDIAVVSRHIWFSYRCRIVGGQPRTSDETDAVEFFSSSALPSLTYATAERLRRISSGSRIPWFSEHQA